ncbi:MAG: PH domain-containing protein [Sulfuricurvum sp.]|uniref:PH domain-containing protein n=1 Tax=Sulfuricurvum sp. TaxID=2025608 RepID=UPI0027355D73|nr:PH domain-containing protein [Sulfuricurvum sp.]MDP2851011.1 PH domain-containing protein [Sulfuricurvum sp.]
MVNYSNSENKLDVATHPCAIEAIVDILLQLFGLSLMYLIFNEIGKYLIGSKFTPDMLLSLVVLPAILVLKSCGKILEPYFVAVSLNNETLSVKQGILTTFEDSLSLKTVENIEVTTTLLGKYRNYATIRVFAYGAWVTIPNVKDAQNIKLRIEDIVKKSKS